MGIKRYSVHVATLSDSDAEIHATHVYGLILPYSLTVTVPIKFLSGVRESFDIGLGNYIHRAKLDWWSA